MSEASLNVLKLDTGEVIKRTRAGERFACPRCGRTLETVPARWREGMALHGIACLTDQRHYYVHIDDDGPTSGMRQFIDELAASSTPEWRNGGKP